MMHERFGNADVKLNSILVKTPFSNAELYLLVRSIKLKWSVTTVADISFSTEIKCCEHTRGSEPAWGFAVRTTKSLLYHVMSKLAGLIGCEIMGFPTNAPQCRPPFH